MLRQLQSVAVVGFFGTMMFFLARDHVIPSLSKSDGIEVDRSVLTDTWVDQDEWLTIRLGERSIGRLRTAAEAERPIAATDSSRTDMTAPPDTYVTAAHLELGEGLFKGRLLTVATLNRRLELETVRVRAHLATLGQEALTGEQLDAEELPKGAYELIGRVEAGVFKYRLRRDSAVQFGSIRLGGPVTVADSITPILRGNMLTKDVTYTVDLFDPIMGKGSASAEIEWVDTRREMVEQDFENIRVIELRYQGTKTLLYVDQNGTVRRREIPLFATGDGNSSLGDGDRGARLMFTRVPPESARDQMPALAYLPKPRPIAAEDLQGTDSGEVIQGLSAMGLLGGNLPTQLTTGEK